jgi:hypothetical protein
LAAPDKPSRSVFPIHRLPSRVRSAFRRVDDLIGTTPLKVLSSYTVYCLEREA